MGNVEIPDGFEVRIIPGHDFTTVTIKLWNQTVYSQKYPFGSQDENKAKVQAAVYDAQRDFVHKLTSALNNY